LSKIAAFAKDDSAEVHMPRIGSGEAGGHWEIVAEIVDESLCGKGVNVTVYDLPNKRPIGGRTGLLFSRGDKMQ
jgi:hypothetical protein